MTILAAFLSAVLGVVIACGVAWLVLSRWLGGRPLVIASVASAVSVGIGPYGYAGPVDGAALVAVGGLAGSVLAGIVIARIWLARATSSNGLIDG